MKIKTTAVSTNTYTIEYMTAAEAAAICFLLGKASMDLSTATHNIYTQLFEALEALGDAALMHAFKVD